MQPQLALQRFCHIDTALKHHFVSMDYISLSRINGKDFNPTVRRRTLHEQQLLQPTSLCTWKQKNSMRCSASLPHTGTHPS